MWRRKIILFPLHDALAAKNGPKPEWGCCKTWGQGVGSDAWPLVLPAPSSPSPPSASHPPGHQDAQPGFRGAPTPVCSFPSPLLMDLLKNRDPTSDDQLNPFGVSSVGFSSFGGVERVT